MPEPFFLDDLVASVFGPPDPADWFHPRLFDPAFRAEVREEFFAGEPLAVSVDEALLPERAQLVFEALEEARFRRHHHHAYRIDVARPHEQPLSTLTELVDFLRTPEAAEFHRRLVDWPNPVAAVQVQIARLRAGDEFEPHVDTDEEGITAVYAFSPGFTPADGGELFFPTEDGRDRIRVPVRFNALTVFRPRGELHGVSKVRRSAPGSRYTLTVFYLQR